ncbi:uncharacterized protein LOC142351652 [Convolutriloba macropyga]|uniref:uncharacterized protein LOC142351652 n=1 Tax=Convolutriloba macropyga TaxID=536237 RepID=UPI003F51D3A4
MSSLPVVDVNTTDTVPIPTFQVAFSQILLSLGSVPVHVVVMSSQIIVILMSMGLEGNSSAQTLMWVQAVADILKRALIVFFVLCSNIYPDICIQRILSDVFCKVNAVVTFLLILQTELIAVLVALDRVIAVFLGVLYKQKGTPSAAWKALAIIWTILLALGIPRGLFFKVNQIFMCASDPPVLVKVTTFVGLIAVLITCVLSIVFIIGLRLRKGGTKRSDKVVLEDREQQGTLFKLSQLAASISAFRAPIYLTMAPMRKALNRAIKLN